MRKLNTLIVVVLLNVTNVFGQCTSLFSFAAYFETVTFSNQSSVPNAHYFWNFGDGTSSYLQNPTHRFPETGDYLVTLFAEDTISNCSSYYEYWVNVTKYSTDSCQPSVIDSLFASGGAGCLKIIDNSINCNHYHALYDGGPAYNYPPTPICLGDFWNIAFRMICRVQYRDTTGTLKREAYKTSLHNYSSSHNYGDCSANFEFSVVSKNTMGQTILFKAMNKTATYYQWAIMGFGSTISSNNDTISQFYPYNEVDIWIVGLMTKGSTGCSDTIYQNILNRDSILTYAGIKEYSSYNSLNVYPNPNNGNFVIETNSMEKQSMQVYDVNGKIVLSQTINGKTNIDAGNLSEGVYNVSITGNNSVMNRKLVIVR